jgi:hypothetical protein
VWLACRCAWKCALHRLQQQIVQIEQQAFRTLRLHQDQQAEQAQRACALVSEVEQQLACWLCAVQLLENSQGSVLVCHDHAPALHYQRGDCLVHSSVAVHSNRAYLLVEVQRARCRHIEYLNTKIFSKPASHSTDSRRDVII